MGSPEISVGGPLITILGHFFEKTVLRQCFFGNARENMATARVREIFSTIVANDYTCLQNKFHRNWKRIGEDIRFYKN